MKLNTKNCRAAYLYADGHVILVKERADKKGLATEWAEAYPPNGTDCLFTGRLIFHYWNTGLLKTIIAAGRVEMKGASTESGSEKTKRAGITVGHIRVGTYENGFSISTFPELIDAPITYQPGGIAETWEDVRNATRWSDFQLVVKK